MACGLIRVLIPYPGITETMCRMKYPQSLDPDRNAYFEDNKIQKVSTYYPPMIELFCLYIFFQNECLIQKAGYHLFWRQDGKGTF